jgi:hypothetical protein
VDGFERVSVYYPRGVRTGGPEALHQLVDTLRSLGCDAALVPMPGTQGRPRVPEYAGYDAPERSTCARGPRDAVVTPEVWVPRRAVTGEATWFCWWLSVDNSPIFMDGRRRTHEQVSPRPAGAVLRGVPRRVLRALAAPARRRRLATAVHVAQSVYAHDVVARELGVAVSMLSDYVPVPTAPALARRGGPPVVAFNPAKGGELVARVADRLTTPVRWLPIERMSPDEVVDALNASDVYLELGHLPGKDRMPREAALRGAVTLVAARGAGANPRDFPVPDAHRIPTAPDLVTSAVRALEDVLADVGAHALRQADFRAQVAQERPRFVGEARACFGSVGSS